MGATLPQYNGPRGRGQQYDPGDRPASHWSRVHPLLPDQRVERVQLRRNRRGQILRPLLGEHHCVLQPHVNLALGELQDRLHVEYHADREGLLGPGARDPAYVMHRYTDEVPDVPSGVEELVAVSMAAVHLLRRVLEPGERDAGLHGGDDRVPRLEHAAIHLLLLGAEAPRDRPGPGEVRGVVLPVRAVVHVHDLAGLHLPPVLHVVHDRREGARRHDRWEGIAVCPEPGADVLRRGSDLVLVHPQPGGADRLSGCLRSHRAAPPEPLDLVPRLHPAQLVQYWTQVRRLQVRLRLPDPVHREGVWLRLAEERVIHRLHRHTVALLGVLHVTQSRGGTGSKFRPFHCEHRRALGDSVQDQHRSRLL
jgi:hypothetical protein